MSENSEKYLLEMQNISKSFSGVQVLSGVNFNLKPGEVHILAGENGAGKSTLMKILGGIHTDNGGQIKIDGDEVDFTCIQDAEDSGISIIHQELSLVTEMSVSDNIYLGREISKGPWLNKSKMAKESQALLEKMGLELDVNKHVEQYPIGIQQMIEITKALAYDSKIIVMDEPTSALTKVEVEKLFKIIDDLKAAGCGIVYISHKMEEIYRIADRITVLRDGEYIGTDTAENLPNDKLINWLVGRDLDQQFPRSVANYGDLMLEVNNITVPDRNGKPIPAVSNVSLEVRSGEILGLAGLQGSGSSELLNAIFGTYGADIQGQVKIDGAPFKISNPANAVANGIALLTNDRKTTGLVLGMSIINNITMASMKKNSPGGFLKPSLEKEVAQVHKKALNIKAASLEMEVGSLSGGNQQKVAMAKWVETNPKVLLLDEPTKGVDVGAKHEIYELMNDWTSQGIAIVLITSEMPELLAMSDRVAVMHRGEITASMDVKDATQENVLAAAMGQKLIKD